MTGGVGPCWQLESAASCSGQVLTVSPDPSMSGYRTVTVTYDCAK